MFPTQFIKEGLCDICEDKCKQQVNTGKMFYNFDNIVGSLWETLDVFNTIPASVDSLYLENDEVVSFIEIKNRNWQNLNSIELVKKIYDSLLFLFKYNSSIKVNKVIISLSDSKNNPFEYSVRINYKECIKANFKMSIPKYTYEISDLMIAAFYTKIDQPVPLKIRGVSCCFNVLEIVLCSEIERS